MFVKESLGGFRMKRIVIVVGVITLALTMAVAPVKMGNKQLFAIGAEGDPSGDDPYGIILTTPSGEMF